MLIFRILVLAFPFLVSWYVYSETEIPLFVYGIVSVLTFLVYALDKAIAVNNRGKASGNTRVPESVLHLLEIFGGFPGALLGQILCRHKSVKTPYQIVFWLIVALHVAVWGVFFYFKSVPKQ